MCEVAPKTAFSSGEGGPFTVDEESRDVGVRIVVESIQVITKTIYSLVLVRYFVL